MTRLIVRSSLLLAAACGHVAPPPVSSRSIVAAEPSPLAAAAPVIQPAPPEAKVEAPASQVALEVPGFEPALFFTPAGSEPRPLLVATHGAGGSPEWECEYWRRLTRERAFLLCLRGTPLGTYAGFYYRDHLALERELVAAEQVVRARDPRIAAGSGVYAGFSQGSTMGTGMIAKHGAAFPYLVLIEGFQLWNVPGARSFAKAGGQRVLIACGSKECNKVGKGSQRWLEAAGVPARLEFVLGAGHTPGGLVMERVAASLSWLLGEDPLWR